MTTITIIITREMIFRAIEKVLKSENERTDEAVEKILENIKLGGSDVNENI